MNIQQRQKKRSKSRSEMCDCGAYSFSHRIGGGKCNRDHQAHEISRDKRINCSREWYESGHGAGDFG